MREAILLSVIFILPQPQRDCRQFQSAAPASAVLHLLYIYGLSVIKNPERAKGKSYYEWDMTQQGLSWKTKLKWAIDECINESRTFEEFLQKLAEREIEAVYAPDKVIDLKFRTPACSPGTPAYRSSCVSCSVRYGYAACRKFRFSGTHADTKQHCLQASPRHSINSRAAHSDNLPLRVIKPTKIQHNRLASTEASSADQPLQTSGRIFRIGEDMSSPPHRPENRRQNVQ